MTSCAAFWTGAITTHGHPACLKAATDLATVLFTGKTDALPKPTHPPEDMTGWVGHTMAGVGWAISQGARFADIVLAAARLGGQAHTTGAVAGQIAGRLFGYEGIPLDWRMALHDHDKIVTIADDLHVMRPIDV